MKPEEIREKYNSLFDKCFFIHYTNGESTENLDELLGGCKFWMEVYLRPNTSKEYKEVALEIFKENCNELEEALKKVLN